MGTEDAFVLTVALSKYNFISFNVFWYLFEVYRSTKTDFWLWFCASFPFQICVACLLGLCIRNAIKAAVLFTVFFPYYGNAEYRWLWVFFFFLCPRASDFCVIFFFHRKPFSLAHKLWHMVRRRALQYNIQLNSYLTFIVSFSRIVFFFLFYAIRRTFFIVNELKY